MTADIYILRTPANPTQTILKIAQSYTNKKLILARDKHSKPYFKNHKKLYFNISHSGSKWVITFSSSPVGIDIEKIKKRNYERIVRRISTKKENLDFIKSKNKKQNFYILWTKKEAISKCIGLGFKYGFEKIETKQWNTKTYKSGRFILTVASKNQKEKFKIATSSSSSLFQPISG